MICGAFITMCCLNAFWLINEPKRRFEFFYGAFSRSSTTTPNDLIIIEAGLIASILSYININLRKWPAGYRPSCPLF